MKKKILSKLIASVVMTSVLLTGCGEQETGSRKENVQADDDKQETEDEIVGIHVTDSAKYQFQLIDPNDIIIEYSGSTPDSTLADYKGTYVTDTSSYLSEEVGICINDEHFSAKVSELVRYTDINWSWTISDEELYQLTFHQYEISPSLFKGVISYSDGSEGTVEPEYVKTKLSRDVDGLISIDISFRGSTYPYNITIPELIIDAIEGGEPIDPNAIKEGDSSAERTDKVDSSDMNSDNWFDKLDYDTQVALLNVAFSEEAEDYLVKNKYAIPTDVAMSLEAIEEGYIESYIEENGIHVILPENRDMLIYAYGDCGAIGEIVTGLLDMGKYEEFNEKFGGLRAYNSWSEFQPVFEEYADMVIKFRNDAFNQEMAEIEEQRKIERAEEEAVEPFIKEIKSAYIYDGTIGLWEVAEIREPENSNPNASYIGAGFFHNPYRDIYEDCMFVTVGETSKMICKIPEPRRVVIKAVYNDSINLSAGAKKYIEDVGLEEILGKLYDIEFPLYSELFEYDNSVAIPEIGTRMTFTEYEEYFIGYYQDFHEDLVNDANTYMSENGIGIEDFRVKYLFE